MKNIFVVVEDYTGTFIGLFDNQKKAQKVANEVGGQVINYNFAKINYDNEGFGDILPIA